MGAGQSLLHEVSGPDKYYDDPAEPTRLVRDILSKRRLPPEPVLDIMELANYYPRVQNSTSDSISVHALPQPDETSYCAARFCLASPPISGPQEGEAWRVHRVVWMVESHDQGWASESTPGET